MSQDLHAAVEDKMLKLSKKGTLGNIASRVISPFVAVSLLHTTLCLRIGSIVEPLFGIIADIAVAMISCKVQTLGHIPFRIAHTFRNLVCNIFYIGKDLVTIGLVVGIGGIFAPECAYRNLSNCSTSAHYIPSLGNNKNQFMKM